MMKTTTRLILTVTLLLSSGLPALYGQELPSEEREVSPFSKINVSVPGHIYIAQGPAQVLIVEGTDRVLENIVTEVRGGQLHIYTPRRWNFRRNDELNVYIVVTELEGLNVSGSARVHSEGLLSTESLSVSISGSGRVIMDELDAYSLSTSVSGSGRFTVGSGPALTGQEISISGSGRIETSGLPAERVKARISGSGRCYVHALADLNVSISGSGRVIYTGTPVIDSRISGSGRLVSSK